MWMPPHITASLYYDFETRGITTVAGRRLDNWTGTLTEACALYPGLTFGVHNLHLAP